MKTWIGKQRGFIGGLIKQHLHNSSTSGGFLFPNYHFWETKPDVNVAGILTTTVTGFPSGVKELFIILDKLASANVADSIVFHLGTNAGIYTGLDHSYSYIRGSGGAVVESNVGPGGNPQFVLLNYVTALANNANAFIRLRKATGNLWFMQMHAHIDNANNHFFFGNVPLPGEFDRFRIQRSGATNWASGLIHIFYTQ